LIIRQLRRPSPNRVESRCINPELKQFAVDAWRALRRVYDVALEHGVGMQQGVCRCFLVTDLKSLDITDRSVTLSNNKSD